MKKQKKQKNYKVIWSDLPKGKKLPKWQINHMFFVPWRLTEQFNKEIAK